MIASRAIANDLRRIHSLFIFALKNATLSCSRGGEGGSKAREGRGEAAAGSILTLPCTAAKGTLVVDIQRQSTCLQEWIAVEQDHINGACLVKFPCRRSRS